MTESDDRPVAVRKRLLHAALPHVADNGWGETTWKAAIRESFVDDSTALMAFPRSGLDLALFYHRVVDQEMIEFLKSSSEEFDHMRFRDRVAYAVRAWFDQADRTIIARSSALFALPANAGRAAVAHWRTVDAILAALGDRSNDVNWYTKRMTLYGVFCSTELYWLGDKSRYQSATWDFLERRIDDVMRIETVKGRLKSLPLYPYVMKAGLAQFLDRISAPDKSVKDDLPGSVSR